MSTSTGPRGLTRGVTSAELMVRRSHLELHRRTIIGRSLAASLAGAIPIPVVDEWLQGVIQHSTFRRLARDYHIELDHYALDRLVYGESGETTLDDLLSASGALGLLSRRWRRVFAAYLATRRAREAARYFVRFTLFDHYCAKLHVGFGVYGDAGLELHQLIESAIEQTPGFLGGRPFRRGLLAIARTMVETPIELIDIASRGNFRRLLARNSDNIQVAEEVDVALERQLAKEESFLTRTAAVIEIQLSAQGNPYLDRVIENFENLWRERYPDAGE